MRDEIIRIAIMLPHRYPWQVELQKRMPEITKEDVDRILSEEQIIHIETRRIIGWEIQKMVYKEASRAKTVSELENSVLDGFKALSFKTEISGDLIRRIIGRKELGTNAKIGFYQAFVSGKLTKAEYSRNIEWVYIWGADILSACFILGSSGGYSDKNALLESINRKFKEMLYSDNYNEKRILELMKSTGFFNNTIIKDYHDSCNSHYQTYAELARGFSGQDPEQDKVITGETKKTNNLDEVLFDMIRNAEKKQKEFPIQNAIDEGLIARENTQAAKSGMITQRAEKMKKENDNGSIANDIGRQKGEYRADTLDITGQKTDNRIEASEISKQKAENKTETADAGKHETGGIETPVTAGNEDESKPGILNNPESGNKSAGKPRKRNRKKMSESKGEANGQNDDVLERIKGNLFDIADILGLKVMTKEEFNTLITEREQIIPNFLKKLMNPSEGAVLSELFSQYSNTENTDVTNIKAAIRNFFNYLMLLGLEIEEDKVGDIVEISSKNLLTDYLLFRPADFDGTINCMVKFPGYRYKNKTLLPPVVKEIKE